MKFVSLGNPEDVVSFQEALSRGIPADGSLYYPVEIPKLTAEQIASLPGLDTKAIDRLMLSAWLGGRLGGVAFLAYFFGDAKK